MSPSSARTSRTRLLSPPNFSSMSCWARVEGALGSSKPPPRSLPNAPTPMTPMATTATAVSISTSRPLRRASSVIRSYMVIPLDVYAINMDRGTQC